MTAASSEAAVGIRRDYVAALAFCILWILFWYRDTAMAMAGIWARSETFTHGFVVLPISLWLIWRQRQQLAALTPRPSLWILPLFACAELAWLLGDLAATNSVTQLAFVSMLVLAVPAVLGIQLARSMAFPLGFLVFAVPIGEFVMPWLMDWTANFTVFALRASGIPVFREGLNFVIPSGHWSVIEACSGVRYLIASLMVGVLFSYLNYMSTRKRLIFIGVSLLVPIVANWLRAYMIVMLGHLSGNKLAVGVDHLIYGWLFFGIVIMLMFIIGARWTDAHTTTFAPPPSVAQPASYRRFWVAAFLLALLAVFPHAAKLLAEKGNTDNPPDLMAALPKLNGGWQRATSNLTDWKPDFVNPSAEVQLAFSGGGNSVGLYIGYYRDQGYDRKVVSSSNVLVSSKNRNWMQVGRGERTIHVDHQTMTLNTAQVHSRATDIQNGPISLVAWQIYWIDGHFTSNDYLAKIYIVLSRLKGTGDDAAVIVLYAPEGQQGDAVGALESFTIANMRAIDIMLRTAGGRQ